MFENTSVKIKSVATILVIVGVVVAVLVGFGLLIALIEVSDSAVGPFFISAIATVSISLISYVSALLIYGFGDIVYNCAKTADTLNTNTCSKPSITTEQLDRLIAAKNDHIISEETFEKIIISTATFDNDSYAENDTTFVEESAPEEPEENTWECLKCGCINSKSAMYCKVCGEHQ